MENIESQVKSLLDLPAEEEWLEFKDSWYDAVGIGEYISSLSNAAALGGRDNAYLIWGIDDSTHELTDTSLNFRKDVKGEPLEHYLARQITPDIGFSFRELTVDGKRIQKQLHSCHHSISLAGRLDPRKRCGYGGGFRLS